MALRTYCDACEQRQDGEVVHRRDRTRPCAAVKLGGRQGKTPERRCHLARAPPFGCSLGAAATVASAASPASLTCVTAAAATACTRGFLCCVRHRRPPSGALRMVSQIHPNAAIMRKRHCASAGLRMAEVPLNHRRARKHCNRGSKASAQLPRTYSGPPRNLPSSALTPPQLVFSSS